ncbi:MAG: molybdopterin molybdotransferase MoeA [bacterium]|nr:molybdopterin molybdotransferase MoeA [bacterium]
MIPIAEAEKIINKVLPTYTPETEDVALMDSYGRVLGRDIISTIDMPPFDKSAMDGYALKAGDDSEKFEVIDTIAAGAIAKKEIGKGQCAKIMTGAMLPSGADRVVKVEVTKEENGYMSLTDEDVRLNICYQGEDITIGTKVLNAGHLLRPPEVGIAASMGLDKVTVTTKAKVAIIATGTEIVPPGQKLEKGQIYNSNAFSIAAQVLRTGADVTSMGNVGDDIDDIKKHIGEALEQNDMVLISGGVSMGDYDFVPGILNDLGVTLHFDKVAIKPGKPTVFGTAGNTLVFGLPGNPVSTFTIFEIFARPLLYRLMGHVYQPQMMKGTMNVDYSRRNAQRTAYLPVRYAADGAVEPLNYHGSAHLAALSEANGFLKIPIGQKEIPKGSSVYVRQI